MEVLDTIHDPCSLCVLHKAAVCAKMFTLCWHVSHFHSAMCRQSGPDDEDLQWHWCCHTFVGGGEILYFCLFRRCYSKRRSEFFFFLHFFINQMKPQHEAAPERTQRCRFTKCLMYLSLLCNRKREIWSWLQRSANHFLRRTELWLNRITIWKNKWDKSQRRSAHSHIDLDR